MTHLKQIAGKILIITLDILLVVYRTLKQLVFPGKKTKGNLLSSLFILSVALIEHIGSFEHGVFSMAVVFKQKHISRALLICCILLCLLSSFEWCVEEPVNATPATCAGKLSSSLIRITSSVFRYRQKVRVNSMATTKNVSDSLLYYDYSSRQSLPVKKYLLFLRLQI